MSRIDDIKARISRCTPGPWERGNRWLVASVNGHWGEGKCAYCRWDVPLVWTGQGDINGKLMNAHIHRMATPPSQAGIYSAQLPGIAAVVAENEEYGLMADGDAEFIVHAPADIAALLAVAEAARAYRQADGVAAAMAGARGSALDAALAAQDANLDALFAALDDLEAGTC